MSNIESWIRSKVGCGYVYGATGWVCSLKRRQQQAEQYPEYAETIMNVCAKWDGKECYDCAQLIRRALESVGVTGVPSGATSQWNKSSLWSEMGVIRNTPSDGLLALFRESAGKMQHVGWRMSDGSVIDARSSQKGVIVSRPEDYKWTHWARPIIGSYDTETHKHDTETPKEDTVMYKATVITKSDPLRVREWAVTGTILGSVPKGKIVDVLEESPDGWNRIRYNELEGYASSEYLERISDVPVVTFDPTATTTTIVNADGFEITLSGDWRVMENG